MLGIVRLYIDHKEEAPEHMREHPWVPVIDVQPDQAHEVKRRLVRRGHEVIAVPL